MAVRGTGPPTFSFPAGSKRSDGPAAQPGQAKWEMSVSSFWGLSAPFSRSRYNGRRKARPSGTDPVESRCNNQHLDRADTADAIRCQTKTPDPFSRPIKPMAIAWLGLVMLFILTGCGDDPAPPKPAPPTAPPQSTPEATPGMISLLDVLAFCTYDRFFRFHQQGYVWVSEDPSGVQAQLSVYAPDPRRITSITMSMAFNGDWDEIRALGGITPDAQDMVAHVLGVPGKTMRPWVRQAVEKAAGGDQVEPLVAPAGQFKFVHRGDGATHVIAIIFTPAANEHPPKPGR